MPKGTVADIYIYKKLCKDLLSGFLYYVCLSDVLVNLLGFDGHIYNELVIMRNMVK